MKYTNRYGYTGGFPGGASGKDRLPTQETQKTLVGSLEGEMAIHSSILAWKIPWVEGAGEHKQK